MKNRIFTKVDRNVRDRLAPLPQTNPGEPNNQVARQLRLRDLAFDSSPLARIVVNHNGILSLASQKAKTQLGLISSDIGRALQELEILLPAGGASPPDRTGVRRAADRHTQRR